MSVSLVFTMDVCFPPCPQSAQGINQPVCFSFLFSVFYTFYLAVRGCVLVTILVAVISTRCVFKQLI